MCVGISGVLKDSVFVLMCVDVCLRLCLFVRNKAVVCQNFRNGDERKQHAHDILTILNSTALYVNDISTAQHLQAGPPKWR